MRFLTLLLLSCCVLSVQAKTQVNLYQAKIAITEQGEAAARNQAMQEVLVRATGDSTVLDNDIIKKALAKSARYVDQISYSQQANTRILHTTFSESQIRGLISQAQLPFWPSSRANILVWLVEENNLSRNIAWGHSDSTLFTDIRQNAQQRGLPLTQPIGDFDDVTNISVADLWGSFTRPISQVSQRYPSDAILLIRAQGSQYNWTLYDRSASELANNSVSTLTGSVRTSSEDFAKQLIDQISDYYAQKNAVTVASESSQSINAVFTHLDNPIDFFKLENKLKNLDSVAWLDVIKIKGDEVTFKVHLLADEERFKQQVYKLDKVSPIEEAQSEALVVESQVPVVPENNALNDESNSTNDSVANAASGNDGLKTETKTPENVVKELKFDIDK